MKLNKDLLLTATLLAAAVGFSACGGSTTNTATTNTANKAATNAATTAANSAANTTTASADKIGIPECDDYIEKYEACVNSKVPEAQRAALKSAFETARNSWKQAAANPQGKAAIASGCKQAHDMAKQQMSAYSCAW